MKKIGVCLLISLFLLLSISSVASGDEGCCQLHGYWGVQGDQVPFGSIKGRMKHESEFVGYAELCDSHYRLRIVLTNGFLSGIVQVGGLQVPVTGWYCLSCHFLFCQWTGCWYHGWIIARMIL